MHKLFYASKSPVKRGAVIQVAAADGATQSAKVVDQGSDDDLLVETSAGLAWASKAEKLPTPPPPK